MRRLVALSSTTRTGSPQSCASADGRRAEPTAPRRPTEAHREVERAPLPDGALDPDPAAHQLDQARGDRQPEPGAAVLARGRAVGLRERPRRSSPASPAGCRCRCRGPRSAGATSVRGPLRGDASTLDDDLAALGELDGVADEVDDDLPQPAGIADEHVGHVGGERGRPAPAPSGGPAGQRSSACRRGSRAGRSRCASSSSLPASILEKSRMSLMTVSSESADDLDHLQVLALLGESGRCRAPARSCR